eukprot:1778815-Amphidinium_carterae.1
MNRWLAVPRKRKVCRPADVRCWQASGECCDDCKPKPVHEKLFKSRGSVTQIHYSMLHFKGIQMHKCRSSRAISGLRRCHLSCRMLAEEHLRCRLCCSPSPWAFPSPLVAFMLAA